MKLLRKAGGSSTAPQNQESRDVEQAEMGPRHRQLPKTSQKIPAPPMRRLPRTAFYPNDGI